MPGKLGVQGILEECFGLFDMFSLGCITEKSVSGDVRRLEFNSGSENVWLSALRIHVWMYFSVTLGLSGFM